jgi:hypothetical protein
MTPYLTKYNNNALLIKYFNPPVDPRNRIKKMLTFDSIT